MHLREELKHVNVSKISRQNMTARVLQNPHVIRDLITIGLSTDEEHAVKAAWILEYIAREQIEALVPHVGQLLAGMPEVKQDSAIRPMARICEALAVLNSESLDASRPPVLRDEDCEVMLQICFDWLISEQKTAVHVFAMQAIFELGKHINWAQPELKGLLEQNYASGSAGYKARARKLLKQLGSS